MYFNIIVKEIYSVVVGDELRIFVFNEQYSEAVNICEKITVPDC